MGRYSFFLACPALVSDSGGYTLAVRVKRVLGRMVEQEYVDHWKSVLPHGVSYIYKIHLSRNFEPLEGGDFVPIPSRMNHVGPDLGPEVSIGGLFCGGLTMF